MQTNANKHGQPGGLSGAQREGPRVIARGPARPAGAPGTRCPAFALRLAGGETQRLHGIQELHVASAADDVDAAIAT